MPWARVERESLLQVWSLCDLDINHPSWKRGCHRLWRLLSQRNNFGRVLDPGEKKTKSWGKREQISNVSFETFQVSRKKQNTRHLCSPPQNWHWHHPKPVERITGQKSPPSSGFTSQRVSVRFNKLWRAGSQLLSLHETNWFKVFSSSLQPGRL